MGDCTNNQSHNLRVVFKAPQGIGVSVVRWCKRCGGVVVDTDYDRRTKPGAVSPMRFPDVAKSKVEG